MAHILVVESSAKKEGSFSRKLASEFVDLLRAQDKGHTFNIRDLAHDPIPVLNDDTVDAIRTPPASLTEEQRSATALSEELIAELKAADYVVIGSAMYNWTIAASLKAWLDQVMRKGMTFEYANGGLNGLLDKPALVVLARGGLYDSPERAAVDMQKPYLKNVLGVLGLKPEFVAMDGTAIEGEIRDVNLAKARAQLAEAAAKFA